jgi:hypothetical protein
MVIGAFQLTADIHKCLSRFSFQQKLFFAVCVVAIILLATTIEYALQAYKYKKIEQSK